MVYFGYKGAMTDPCEQFLKIIFRLCKNGFMNLLHFPKQEKMFSTMLLAKTPAMTGNLPEFSTEVCLDTVRLSLALI